MTIVIHAGELPLPPTVITPDHTGPIGIGFALLSTIHIVTKSYRKRAPLTSSDYDGYLDFIASDRLSRLVIVRGGSAFGRYSPARYAPRHRSRNSAVAPLCTGADARLGQRR